MSLSQEFIISLFVQLLILAFFVGIYVATIRFMGKQIEDIKTNLFLDKKELKEEMKKYNNVLERLVINEQRAKSAHKRIDDLIEGR